MTGLSLRSICLDCHSAKPIDREHAYCKETGKMVKLSRGSCEMFKDALAPYRTLRVKETEEVLKP